MKTDEQILKDHFDKSYKPYGFNDSDSDGVKNSICKTLAFASYKAGVRFNELREAWLASSWTVRMLHRIDKWLYKLWPFKK